MIPAETDRLSDASAGTGDGLAAVCVPPVLQLALNAAHTHKARSTGVVLIVDDDAVTRLAFQRILEKRGFVVLCAATGADARHMLEQSSVLDAAVLDYSLPDANGIELLTWLRGRDPQLAAILVTAMGEKAVVARSLSEGACGYLDKPVSGVELSREVTKIVALTRRRRRLARMVEEVHQVGQILQSYHHALVQAQGPDGRHKIGLHYYPHFEVGGDYLVQRRISGTEWLVMSVDVSGHDLSAACTSSFFQGLCSGIFGRGGSAEEVLRQFHHSLIEQQRLGGPDSPMVSAAVCCLTFRPGVVDVVCYGSPQPVMVEPSGTARRMGAAREPLGWFEEFEWRPQSYLCAADASVLIWTDGLEDLAGHLGIDPLALAFSVSRTGEGQVAPGIDQATDDIMLASISPAHPTPGDCPDGASRTFLAQIYGKEHLGSIDALQENWKRSLRWALPEINDGLLHDILLCSREAVLNSLRHGCGDSETMTLLFRWRPWGVLEVQVDDPGEGHEYDWNDSLTDRGDGMQEFSRGLLLIHMLPSAVRARRGGAHLTLEFDLR